MGSNEVWFVLPKLQMGGIERNRIRVLKQCLEWGVNVRLILVERQGCLLEGAPATLPISVLGKSCKVAFPFRLARLIRSQRPTCIISAFDDLNVMVIAAKALAKSGVPVLLSNHSTFSMARGDCTGLKRTKYNLLSWALPWAFKRAKSVVAVSEGVADDLSRSLSVPRESFDLIYNPVMGSDFHERLRWPPLHQASKETLLFVGRLARPKDIPNLLGACTILKQRRHLDVLIVGDGPERSMIEAQVNKMGLTGSVRLVGVVQNPLPLMSRCGLLVLPSRFEGLGNVLIEAMACGTQVVSTDCPHGPAEVLDGGRYGQLVPVGDPAALAAAIERSLDGEFRVDPDVLRARAAEFSVEKATRRYLELAGYDVSTLPPSLPATSQNLPTDD